MLADMTRFSQKSLRGFSTLETLLAAFVLTIGLVIVMEVMTRSIRHSFETRDAIVATMLSQEGAELVRNFRDNDFATGNDGFSESFDESDKYCYFDYRYEVGDIGSYMRCSQIARPNRYFLNYSNGSYVLIGAREKYSRYMYVDYDESDKTATVRSYVYWGAWGNGEYPPGNQPGLCTVAGTKKCVVTESFLTSWR